MLTRRERSLMALRAGAAATAGLLLTAGLAAPASAAPAARSGFGSGAGRTLVSELLKAWQITHGHGVTVAVISGGVDGGVTGLSGKVTQGPAFGGTRGDSTVEGTVFASAVAGDGPNSANPFGLLGLAPAARILSVRLPGKPAPGTFQIDEAEAIRYAAAHGAQVIASLDSGYHQSEGLDGAVQYAESRGAVVVGLEFGMNNTGLAQYPSLLPGVVDSAWAALSGLPAPLHKYTNPASEANLVTAPANSIVASGPAGQSYVLYGEGAATAWLTATAALIKSVYPGLPPSGVARAIAVSATGHPAGGYTPSVGFGLINPVGALRAAQSISKLRTSAAPGRGVAAPGARLAAGPPPGPIDAVHHSPAVLAADGGAIALGLALLLTAAVVWRRRGRRPEPAAALAGPAPGPDGMAPDPDGRGAGPDGMAAGTG